MPDITLYYAKYSRGFTPLWLLEEIGIPYKIEELDLTKREHKAPAYLALNPMGKVPALKDGDVVVTESPAICLYLADRYSYGVLAPKIEEPERGAYLRWTVFASTVLEPGMWMREPASQRDIEGRGWGDFDDVVRAMEQAIGGKGPWVLGERFSAADVMLGAVVGFGWYNGKLPHEAPFADYFHRIEQRPAFTRASERTWGQ